jgi:alkylhydroperoxidase family enzyme
MTTPCFVADKISNVPGAVTDAIRNDTAIPDERLSALARFTRVMVEQRGLPKTGDVAAFLAAGYSERQILEIILAISVKTLSNYANHLFHTPVDAIFASRTWEGPRSAVDQTGTVK